MKVLILSKDKSLFSPESVAYQDVLRSSEHVAEMHVVVFTTKKDLHVFSKVSDNLFIYPTNSAHRWFSIWDVFNIVKSQMFWKSSIVIDLICARDSLRAIIAAYFLSKKHKKNYTIDISDNGFLFHNSKNMLKSGIRARIFDFMFAKASAIRVTSQTQGEMIYARNPSLGKKIFILPLLDLQIKPEGTTTETGVHLDIHEKYKQFNLILLVESQFMNIQDLKRAKTIMHELRLRYPRIGLVIVSEIKNSVRHPFFMKSLPDYIVIEYKTAESIFYCQNANIFIDIGGSDYGGEELIRAIHAGCPVIASDTSTNTNLVQDGENGFICDPQKTKLFARKVMDILETRGLRERMHMYRYNITDLYGTDQTDYYKRLVTIWETHKTPEGGTHAELPIIRVEPEKTGFYPAFNLDTVKKVFKRFEKDKQIGKFMYYNHEQGDVFDVDSVKTGIKKALEELAADPDFQTAEVDKKEEEVEI